LRPAQLTDVLEAAAPTPNSFGKKDHPEVPGGLIISKKVYF